MGRFAGLVAELEECAEVSRRAFEGVRSAGREVTSADLTELLSALGGARPVRAGGGDCCPGPVRPS